MHNPKKQSNMAAVAVFLITIATVLTQVSSHGARTDACKICHCTQNSRVVTCSKKHVHGNGISLLYPDNVQLIVMNRVNITMLDKDMFKGASNLVELRVQHCGVRVVHKEAFNGLDRLQKLTLANNHIEALPEGLFQHCPKLNYLSLQHNKISIQDVGHCLPSAPNLETLDINGLPMDTDSNYTLTPGYAHLSKLKSLHLEDSLENLTSNFFQHLSNSSLEFLSLSKNQFVNISQDALLPLPHLKRLDFVRTNVPTSLAENLFEAISQANISLQYLDLRHNFVYDDAEGALDGEMFHALQNVSLKVLHMESSYGGFHGVIHNQFFKYLSSLEELYLDRSEIRRIYKHAFMELHQLKVLSLAGNYLHCLKGCDFMTEEFKNLEHLDLSENVITDRAKAFSFDRHHFPSLQTLNVKNNRLVVIEKSIFKSLKHLQRLDLSMNPLTRIDPEAFAGMRHLQQLKISDCPQLKDIQPQVFAGLRAVRTLKLDNNGLIKLHPKTFNGLQRLESLSLRNNKLGGDHHFKYNVSVPSTNLTFLDLGQNELEALPIGLLGNQPQLTSLYLDHNRITTVDEQVTSALHSIELLDISYNDIMWLDAATVNRDNLPQLTTLSLAGNPFLCTCPFAPFIHELREALRDRSFHLIAQERHLCLGPESLQGLPLLSYNPTEWDCYVKLYLIPVVILFSIIIVTFFVGCICRKRTNRSDSDIEEYTEQEAESSPQEAGHLTQTNGSVVGPGSSNGDIGGQTSSSSMDSSQSSITGLCVPFKNFRTVGTVNYSKKKKNSTHASNGNAHVLLNEEYDSDIDEPQELEIEEADAIV